jgi:SAM-dependent methyltransferase
MVISFLDKLKALIKAYECIPGLPAKYKIYIILKPFEATRYVEFTYIIKYLNKLKNNHFQKILDVSSPFIVSYYFAKNSDVIKTDISPVESKYFKKNGRVPFKIEDATNLSFADNSFDFTFSISAIEHIYKNYLKAIREIIRVTKKGGLIYLSFPVSKSFKEEWLDGNIYFAQKKANDRTFFQYRFDQDELNRILTNISHDVEVLDKAIYWEKQNGSYDKMIKIIRNKISFFNFLRESIINLYYGFTLFSPVPGDFTKAKDFGNISLILKKL